MCIRDRNEEHWDVVADEVPVSLLCIKFHGEAAHVARRVHRSGAARYRRNAGEQRRHFARPLEQVGLGDIGERFVVLEIACAAEPRACTIRSEIRSWSKWNIFSRRTKSSSRVGPRAPARSEFCLSETRIP